ncbi:helix-turn-helix domain-containing protein [Pelomicrobium methylotrophicum]|uniref:Helix-turn-helix domain-containing protein n=2 Tax=Pelomicrobium methylotrophicum TaxID=2602750 RepID=A0A5C7ESP0_9PROT|nr:helix-turn-helix domain-containing protein [Pelomicrobium methylotrophicum]
MDPYGEPGSARPGERMALGRTLRALRRQRGLSCAAAGEAAGLSERTVRALEHGAGSWASLERLLTVLEGRVDGRGLPPGEDLARRLRVLAGRRRLSRRALARMAGVSAASVRRLLERAEGHVAGVVAVAAALGVRLRCVPQEALARYYSGAALSSASHEWQTPGWLLERLYPLLPGRRFDLDPCAAPGSPVRARIRYTAAEDGLERPWRGYVFLNPPYGRELPRWVAKAAEEAACGAIVTALLPARTDTRWWHDHIMGRTHLLLLRGRLRFGDGRAPAPFPSALALWAPEALGRQAREAFPEAAYLPPVDGRQGIVAPAGR